MTDCTKGQIQEAINFCKKDPDTMDIIALARHIHSVPPILKEPLTDEMWLTTDHMTARSESGRPGYSTYLAAAQAHGILDREVDPSDVTNLYTAEIIRTTLRDLFRGGELLWELEERLKESMPPQVEATPLEPPSDWAR